MSRNRKNSRKDKLMSAQKVAAFCKKLKVGTPIRIRYLDSGKKYLDVFVNPKALSILWLMGHFIKYNKNAVAVASDWDITEEECCGTMNLVADHDIYELHVVK